MRTVKKWLAIVVLIILLSFVVRVWAVLLMWVLFPVMIIILGFYIYDQSKEDKGSLQ